MDDQPTATIEFPGGQCITLLGTAHVSRTSAEAVRARLASGDHDAVAVELCPSRHQSLMDPASLERLDIFQVVRRGQAPMVAASLALGAYQQRLAEQFGIEPGADMKAAVETAREDDYPVHLIDRDIGTTLRRIYRNVPWWRRFALIGSLFGSLISRERISEDEVERLKEGDILESSFSEFASDQSELYQPLIAERDEYMALRLRQVLSEGQRHILAVIGAGHLAGIRDHLERAAAKATPVADDAPRPAGDGSLPTEANSGQGATDETSAALRRLDSVPPPARWPKFIPWIIVALVLIGFIIGFSRSSELGWSLITQWVLINGGLSALGAAIALAHPLTVVTAFLAAPLTSLNPTIGAGMVVAAVETVVRRPKVADFSSLRHDAAQPGGWWRNRVTRILLIFILASLGSAAGTYLAGALIAGRLFG
ncbi:MAG: TraB/GumN family protein [Pseudomonadota bacterium]